MLANFGHVLFMGISMASTISNSFPLLLTHFHAFPLLKDKHHSSLPFVPSRSFPLPPTLSRSFPHIDINHSLFRSLHSIPFHSIPLHPFHPILPTPFHSVPFLLIPHPQFTHEKSGAFHGPRSTMATTTSRTIRDLIHHLMPKYSCEI